MINRGAFFILALGLYGCAAPRPPELWVRTDGRSMRAEPTLQTQLQIDQIACNGEMQKASLSGVTFAGGGIAGAIAQSQRNDAATAVGKGCMAEKGYVLVPEDQAADKSAEFAKAHAANAKLLATKPPARR